MTRKPETEPCYYLGGVTNDVANLNFFRILDKKEYELKDHLGNVRVAIGDMKLPENEATSTRGVPPFLTDEKAVNDYYPYGMTIADRSWQSTDYRYGFNMQEKSTEIDPFGNHNTAEFWEYDARSGRRWNREPLIQKYPYNSSYLVFGNNPIMYGDPNGQDKHNMWIYYIEKQSNGTFEISGAKAMKNEDGSQKSWDDGRKSGLETQHFYYEYNGVHANSPTDFRGKANEAGEFFRLKEKNQNELTTTIALGPFAVGAAFVSGPVSGFIALGGYGFSLFSTAQNSANNTSNPTSILPAAGKQVGNYVEQKYGFSDAGKWGETAGNVANLVSSGYNAAGAVYNIQKTLQSVPETVKAVNNILGSVSSGIDTFKSWPDSPRSSTSYGILKSDANSSLSPSSSMMSGTGTKKK